MTCTERKFTLPTSSIKFSEQLYCLRSAAMHFVHIGVDSVYSFQGNNTKLALNH